jgi:hypothetical protein
MHRQNQRQRLLRPRIAVGVGARRQRQVGHQGQPVARNDLDWRHRLQRRELEIGPVPEQRRETPPGRARAIEEIGSRRRRWRLLDDNPTGVVGAARGDGEIAGKLGVEIIEVGLGIGAKRAPFTAQVFGRERFRDARRWIEPHINDIGPFAFADQRAFAGDDIDTGERGAVAFGAFLRARIQHEEMPPIALKADQARRERILERHRGHDVGAAALVEADNIEAAVGAIAHAEAHGIAAIEQEA